MSSHESEHVTNFVLNHMKINDMRPEVHFLKGDHVKVKDTEIKGMIQKIDPDGRLAWLGNGWWYLKDLELISLHSREDTKNAKKMKDLPAYLLTGNKRVDDLTVGIDLNCAFEKYGVVEFVE